MAEIKLTKRIKYAGDVFKALTERAGFPVDTAADFLNSLPDVDAVPVVHGRWVYGVTLNHEWMKCSECLVSQEIFGCFTYCPNCGAKMDGGSEG